LAADLKNMELRVDIDEADIGKVKVGNEAFFTVEAYQGRTFPAVISELRFAPKTVDGVVTYEAILSIDNADLLLRPGMTATADIKVAEIRRRWRLPMPR
jgi:HlyD family secretion protein